jgi:energy-coupling factor transporter ATP-binding protein EcfA2
MITKLRIENFRAWHDSGSLQLAPVTLLLGSNGSGKSAFMQSLQLLAGTAQDTDFHVALNGTRARALHIQIGTSAGEDLRLNFVRGDTAPHGAGLPPLAAALQARLHYIGITRNLDSKQLDTLLHNTELLSSVAGWLRRMEIVDDISPDPDTGNSLVAHKYGRQTPVSTTGTGLSMILPLIMTLCQLSPGTIVLIAEPEAHLHPLAQAVIAELITEVAHTRQLQIIMETHSEHLFRRLQTLIARGSWQSRQTAVYFVEPAPDGPQLHALTMDSNGRVLNWPDRFFGDALGDTREQARLILSRLATRSL